MKNKKYLIKRKAELMQQQLEYAIQLAKPIEDELEKARLYLIELYNTLPIRLVERNSFLSMHDTKKILSIMQHKGSFNELKKHLLKLNHDEEIQALLSFLDSPQFISEKKRFDELIDNIDKLTLQLKKQVASTTLNTMKQVAKTGYTKSIEQLQEQAQVKFNIDTIDKKHIERLMNYKWNGVSDYEYSIDVSMNKLSDTLKNEFMIDYLTRRSRQDTIQALEYRFNISKYEAYRIVRTESTRIQAEVEAQSYEDLGIEKYEFLSVLDNRTSPICTSLNGKVFNVKDRQVGVNFPPMHVLCRSTTIANFDIDEYNKEYEQLLSEH